MLNDQILKELLIKQHYILAEDLKKAENYAKVNHASFLDYLYHQGKLSDQLLGQAISEHYGVDFADIGDKLDPDKILLLPENIAHGQRAILFEQTEKEIKIATDQPHQIYLKESLSKIYPNKKVTLSYANTKTVDEALTFYKKDLSIRITDLKKGNDSSAPSLVSEIFNDALTARASDIHFEPQLEHVLVRFRIDGVLHEMSTLDKLDYLSIINRIKVLADLRSDDHFSAQDGAIRYETKNGLIDMRISIVPTVSGEKIVIRILSYYIKNYTLEDIGLSDDGSEIVNKASVKPFGMILVVGPTGSGKTTTLYAVIKLLQSPNVNITTIEDPVEFRIPGINQIQVNTQTNLTFAKGLRSIARQDPNIILVGEIRDNETAEIAVNSALTGHLVVSTFHANDAASAFPRLLDMGVEPFLLTSTLELIVAQRLVRKICPTCRFSKVVKRDDLKKTMNHPETYFTDDEVTLYEGKGCKSCNNTGYKGRTGIFEFIRMTEEMKILLLTKPSSLEISKLAKSQGFKSMYDDGIEKVKTGITTLQELTRVANPPE
jgi:type II secretory ATPase GspE/PulE/Tfp pilus assembly ATPase PilB-like protein